MDRREYVCNQMYKQHDLLRRGSWTDADKLEYMELNIAPYSRYWRMGMKKALKHAIRLLREEEEKADRKTEPSSSEIPNNCEVKNYCDDCLYTDTCDSKEFFYACTSKATISKMEQVDKDINVRSKDEPQTDWETEKRDNSLCYKCVKECDRRVLNRYTIECNQYEPKDESQTEDADCDKCIWSVCNYNKAFAFEDEPQTDTEIAKAIVHKMIDDAVIAEDAYPDLRQKMHDAVDEYEPQTDCAWR